MERSLGRSGEFELIARYFAPLAKGFPGAYGLTDDAAVITPAAGHELVAKTDAIVGGVHFLAADPPDLVARKALRVNLSDLAAKGAVPRAYMLDLMLPDTLGDAWVAGFARGLAQDQQEYGVHLIGGDTDATPGPMTTTKFCSPPPPRQRAKSPGCPRQPACRSRQSAGWPRSRRRPSGACWCWTRRNAPSHSISKDGRISEARRSPVILAAQVTEQ